MQYDNNTPRAELTIAGMKLSAIAPYDAGHEVTDEEASVLNQTLRENLRNNFAGKLEAMKEAAAKEGKAVTPEEVQAEFDKYMAEYSFGVRKAGGGAPRLDPVEREVRKIARKQLTEALKKKGYTIKEVPEDQFESWLAELIKRDAEGSKKILTAAQTIVAAAAAVGDDEGMDLGLKEKAA